MQGDSDRAGITGTVGPIDLDRLMQLDAGRQAQDMLVRVRLTLTRYENNAVYHPLINELWSIIGKEGTPP